MFWAPSACFCPGPSFPAALSEPPVKLPSSFPPPSPSYLEFSFSCCSQPNGTCLGSQLRFSNRSYLKAMFLEGQFYLPPQNQNSLDGGGNNNAGAYTEHSTCLCTVHTCTHTHKRTHTYIHMPGMSSKCRVSSTDMYFQSAMWKMPPGKVTGFLEIPCSVLKIPHRFSLYSKVYFIIHFCIVYLSIHYTLVYFIYTL